MTKLRLITKSSAKQVVASAISDAKARNRWSNSDLGTAIDASEGTVRNRLDTDTSDNQMTVYELVRAVAAGEVIMASKIISDLCGHHLVPDTDVGAPSPHAVAAESAQCAANIIAALPDDIDADEAGDLVPQLERLVADTSALIVSFRMIAARRPRSRRGGGEASVRGN